METPAPIPTGPTDHDIRVPRNVLYAQEPWYCLGLFIFIIGAFQWGSFLHSKFARRRQVKAEESDPESASSARARGFALRRLPLAVVNTYRVVAFRWTLEIGESYTLNVAEVFVTAAYIIFLYVWAFMNTKDVEGYNLDLTYWCNRAGTLGSAQFPLITALGTKNNLVSLVTGIGYDKLNYIHRMMSRVVLILLWVHAGSEVIYSAPIGPMLVEAWVRCGIVAIVALTLLCVVSIRPVRAGAYEFFFYAHFFMVLIFLICAYFHTYGMMTFYIYPCFVIWGLDRLVRLIRLVVFNHSYFGLRSGSTLDATPELVSENCVRLRFRRPAHFRWTPGQTAYLIMPGVSRLPFEAHPFTIASFDSKLFDSVDAQECKSKVRFEPGTGRELAEHALGASTPFWKDVVFFINVRAGFTARLKEAALKGGKVKVFVDGPYGSTPDLGSFDTSILIAGGSGVSYILPTFLNVIEQVRNGKSDCRRVVFIWSVRDADHVQWIDETLIRAIQLAPPSLTISIQIHVTGTPASIAPLVREKAGTDADADTDDREMHLKSVHTGSENGKDSETDRDSETRGSEKTKDTFLAMDAVKVEQGRVNLPELLREEVELAAGRMSVSVCGSQGIVRSVRRGLRFPVSSPSNVLNGGPSVTLHIESFGYA
ncbi:ferric reductase NAD binding domain-containing protein [Hygrophoropsis aurantiaca]|uniref:Ferric reductase NAD binding domain-containing protein n=1 Tax=Hygrophoropsis aurantiaca TaxID=72124 RepID=A0ACB8AEK5_9AGAM|nr:ferric reductase NAD binding domain-containing protein [Hygrophoropsis aurantiaca]